MEAKRRVYFSRGCESFMCGVVSEALTRGKLVIGDNSSEGSQTEITSERIRKRGYEAMLDVHKKIAPHLNEPLYTRPVRTVV